jgi:hypothetical protein
MSGIYEEIEIEDMTFDDSFQMYHYPCPCGDKFEISLEELYDGEDIGTCPSCTLRIRIIFDEDTLPELREEEEEDDDDEEKEGKVDQESVQEIAKVNDSSSEIKVEIITREVDSINITNDN